MARTAKTMSFEGMSNAYNPYLDFLSGNQKNLVGTPITPDDAALDAVVAGGATAAEIVATSLVANAVNTTDWTANAEGKVFLPDATEGTHLALKFTGDMDEANALTIAANGWKASEAADATTGNVFAYQLISPLGAGIGVHTAGTAAAPTSVNMIYTPAAADTNCLGINSIIHFFCLTEGEWMVRMFNIPETTGVTGTFTVS